jgi:hypothetical protein
MHRDAVYVVFALIAVCLLFAWCAAHAAAGELSREQSALIYHLAAEESGLPLPDRAPVIEIVPLARLQEVSQCKDCPVRGAQLHGRVYVSDELDFGRCVDASILLHELVHFLQQAKLGPVRDCDDWRERELQAFQAQLQALRKGGCQIWQTLDNMRLTLRMCTDGGLAVPG